MAPPRGVSSRSRSALRAASPEALEEWYGAGLVASAVLLLAAADGGFFPSAWHPATIALAAGGALVALRLGRLGITRAGIALLAALAALTAWTALSASWSLDAHASLLDAQRLLLYLVAAAAFVVARRGTDLGVVLGATAVAVWALATRSSGDPFEGSLLTGPIGYANALGALVAIAGVVAVLRRGPALFSLLALAPALALTNSRGAELAALLGLAVGMLVARDRRRDAALAVAAAAAGLILLLTLPVGGLGARSAYWETARGAVASHPLAGSGAGTFARVYGTARPAGPPARNAHSLYLETLDELGAVGLALLLAALVTPLAYGLRRASAPAVGGYAVFVLHAGVDWDWTMPVVAVAGLAIAAALLDR